VNSLRKKPELLEKCVPQGLKPNEFSAIYGTAEAEPFQNISHFRKL
jgi:hypothetical protein